MQVVVGVADCRITSDTRASLVTYALGSCVAVAIHDPVARVGGMLHLMLPDSSLDAAKAERNPYMFADTGIPMLFRRAYAAGADKKRLVVRIAGGAHVMGDGGVFNIGKRNCLTVKKVLWRAGVIISAESVGGRESRTVRLEVDSGRFLMRTAGGAEHDLDERSHLRRRMASILIVDDSSAMRSVIKRILTLSGFEMDICLDACDGEDALLVLRSQPIDLVISDISMPRMDGETLLREMSADPALCGIPVVIVSSDPTESRASRLLELGANAYLVKPFQPQVFRDKLEQLLEAVHA